MTADDQIIRAQIARARASLAAHHLAIPSAVAGIDDETARWRPPSGAWSIVEVVRHLVDEETEDFGTRLRMTLEDPAQPWPAIDPEGAAIARDYRSASLAESVATFARRRADSLGWLRSLPDDTDWSRAYVHPKFGPQSAGMLLASWAAHDVLHLRQIAKRRFELLSDGPFDTGYAGAW